MKTPLKRFILFILVINFFCQLNSQNVANKEFQKAVQDADLVYLYDADYVRAAAMYEALLMAHPGNANLSSKLGVCYLNIEGRKEDALKLLRDASKNVVDDDGEYVFYGDKASTDTYLYLAGAYQINDSLDKALSIYYDTRKKLGKFDAPKEEYIDIQIGNCRYAEEMKKKPLTVLSDLFAPWLKDYPGAMNPVLAKNDSVFIFTQKTGARTRILCSYKNKGQWDSPHDITKQLGGYDRFYSNSITGDGKMLVLFMDDGGDGNLYFSHRNDTIWSRIKSPGKPVNTIYWESFGFITPDGKTLYISSNRPGGAGDLDIWYSVKKPDGSWGEPINCGEVINSPYDDDTPFFDDVNNALIFSSKGHVGMGGFDVFRSTKRYDSWTNPVSLPYAFNTTTDNKFFILNNKKPGFIASRFDDRTKTRNIYQLVAIDPADEITTADGSVTLSDGLAVDPKETSIKLADLKKKVPVRNIPVNNDGSFRFEIKPGDYQLFVSHAGYKTDTMSLNLPLYYLSHYMVLNSKLIPEKVADGSFLSIKNVLFAFDSYRIDNEARTVLEEFRTVLLIYPELKIEVAGYTDARGSNEYNLKLADKRAQAVIDYFISKSVPAQRFVKKAFGKSNFAAINANVDGSDNPEGRKYNRRVTFGIVDPQTGIVLRQESFTPDYLRSPSSLKYSIVLKSSATRLPESQFNNIKLNGMLVVRTIQSGSEWFYTVGLFYNMTDASKYLMNLKEKGYKEAYIVSQYDLKNASLSQSDRTDITVLPGVKKIYTIQIKAAKSPINMDLFSKISNTREIKGEDGYYRYVSGKYTGYNEARDALNVVIQAGFKDAFIREMNSLELK